MEKLSKIFTDLILNMDAPSFFKEMVVKDFCELEAKLNHIEIMYGITLSVDAKPAQKPQGRWLGKGIVESTASLMDLYKN